VEVKGDADLLKMLVEEVKPVVKNDSNPRASVKTLGLGFEKNAT
jgi:hypothetical protein